MSSTTPQATDGLKLLFELREEYMRRLTEKTGCYSEGWPMDLTKKSSQLMARDIVLRGVEEMFEALQELKNAKPHRQTDLPQFNEDHFLEEVVDGFNYFLSVLILTGFTEEDLLKAYVSKHKKILERIENGY
jgi:hypothetical protein